MTVLQNTMWGRLSPNVNNKGDNVFMNFLSIAILYFFHIVIKKLLISNYAGYII